MSSSNMVADNNLKMNELKGLLMFDTTKVVKWSKRFRMWLKKWFEGYISLVDLSSSRRICARLYLT